MKKLIVTVTSYLCHMDNLPLYWYYWLTMQAVAKILIVTAVTASSAMDTISFRAGLSSRPEHHRGDTEETVCSYHLVASNCFWKQNSVSQPVDCSTWRRMRFIYSGCQEKWKGHYYKSFYDINKTVLLHRPPPSRPSSCQPVAACK